MCITKIVSTLTFCKYSKLLLVVVLFRFTHQWTFPTNLILNVFIRLQENVFCSYLGAVCSLLRTVQVLFRRSWTSFVLWVTWKSLVWKYYHCKVLHNFIFYMITWITGINMHEKLLLLHKCDMIKDSKYCLQAFKGT